MPGDQSSLVDSLKTQINNLNLSVDRLTSSNYDSVVTVLSAMSRYKDCYFLTLKQTERCMTMLAKKADKYIIEREFDSYNYPMVKIDTIYEMYSYVKNCFINFDATQSLQSIAIISEVWSTEEYDRNKKYFDIYAFRMHIDIYYNYLLKICFVKMHYKLTGSDAYNLNEQKNYNNFERDLLKL